MEIKLYNTDCRDLLSYVGQAHLLCCDPPYRDHVHNAATSQSQGGGTRKRDLGFDSIGRDLRVTIASAAHLVQGWTLIYSDVESGHVWRASIDRISAKLKKKDRVSYVRTLPWVRWSMPQLTGTMPPQSWEIISIFHPASAKSWNGPGNFDELSEESVGFEDPQFALRELALRGEDKHKTEKPLDQALRLVSWFSKPGQTVVDLTAGRGTTAVACALLDRGFVGAEIDPIEYAKALVRIDDAVAGILSDRDTTRVERYHSETLAELDSKAQLTPKALERRKVRIDDADRVWAKLNRKKAA